MYLETERLAPSQDPYAPVPRFRTLESYATAHRRGGVTSVLISQAASQSERIGVVAARRGKVQAGTHTLFRRLLSG